MSHVNGGEISLLDLPLELLVMIIDLLEREDRCKLRLTCKGLKNAVDDPLIWRCRRITLTPSGLRRMRPHLMTTLKMRKVSSLSMSAVKSIPPKTLRNIFNACQYLQTLECCCYVVKWLSSNCHVLLQHLERLIINFDHCKCGLMGSCMESLTCFQNLRCLHLALTCHMVRTLSTIFSHIQKLSTIEELSLNADIKEIETTGTWNSKSLDGFNIAQLPNLRNLALHGIPADGTIFQPADGQEDFAEELKLQSLELGRVSHFEGWIHRVKSVSHLLLVLKPHLINPTLDLVKLNLGNIKHLWIQVEGLGVYPILFESLPLSLNALTLYWTIGGMIRKDSSVLQQIPPEVRGNLHKLHLPQVRLTGHDLKRLTLDFCSLHSMSFSLADAVGEQDLLHLASHPSLRRISLWFSLKEKFERCAQHLEEMTQYRLTVRFDASMTRIHRDMYKIY